MGGMTAREETHISGDGWAAGPGGSKLWGKFGAAGLFLLAGDKLLLQHRAEWTNHGGTWGIPGGARDLHETPEEAALRETFEECAIAPADVEVLCSCVTSGPFPPAGGLPGNWTYTTVIARTRSGQPLAVEANEESNELRWVPLGEVEKLPLLGAFRQAFPALLKQIEGLRR
ncbi:NUDIX domain-containing protein [Corynebacterium striatum]|uniref:NUDIX domain-containing protein n=1 Tax=Corynebacterium striatum TaxID=43770 RepID=UPI003B5AE134